MHAMPDAWMNRLHCRKFNQIIGFNLNQSSIEFLTKSLTKNIKHQFFICRQERKMFPVKLTEPITAILYITQDKEHIEELRHAIHVKEVAEGSFIDFQIVFFFF